MIASVDLVNHHPDLSNKIEKYTIEIGMKKVNHVQSMLLVKHIY